MDSGPTGAAASGNEKAVEATPSWQGSTTNSLGSSGAEVAEEEPILTPSMMDCRRLVKMKADQGCRLKMLRARVGRLACQERRVWKDVALTQQRSLQAQEYQWSRQAGQAERIHLERDLISQEQVARDRARELRLRRLVDKGAPRLEKFEMNQAVGRQTREESKQLEAALKEVREQALQSKIMQVEVRRQRERQQRLRKELEKTRREQVVQEAIALKFADLQEELQNNDQALACAEREEMSAVSRLQNSQSVRSEVVSQLQDIERTVGTLLAEECEEETDEATILSSSSHFASSESAAAAGGRLGRAVAGGGQRSLRSRQVGGSSRSQMVSDCMGLDQITEERQEDEGVERMAQDT